jgi:hypothetical protein
MYNSGDVAGCAQLYAETARALATSGSLTEVSAFEFHELTATTATVADDANSRAWALRHAFDRFLGDVEFAAPRIEAKMPPGFPPAGRAGFIEEKSYPAYRAAVARRATGEASAFGLLFRHISSNSIAMTTPVVSRLVEGEAVDMAFLYEQVRGGRDGGWEGGAVRGD